MRQNVFITLILSKSQTLNANLWSLYSKRFEFIVCIFNCEFWELKFFWLLRPSNSSGALKEDPTFGFLTFEYALKNIVLYLLYRLYIIISSICRLPFSFFWPLSGLHHYCIAFRLRGFFSFVWNININQERHFNALLAQNLPNFVFPKMILHNCMCDNDELSWTMSWVFCLLTN